MTEVTGIDCPHCKEGKLIIVLVNEPWNIEYYICNKCDSTFNINEIILGG